MNMKGHYDVKVSMAQATPDVQLRVLGQDAPGVVLETVVTRRAMILYPLEFPAGRGEYYIDSRFLEIVSLRRDVPLDEQLSKHAMERVTSIAQYRYRTFFAMSVEGHC